MPLLSSPVGCGAACTIKAGRTARLRPAATRTKSARVLSLTRPAVMLLTGRANSARGMAWGRSRKAQADRRLRPLARRDDSTRQPAGVAIRERKPWRRLRASLLGREVRFDGT